MAWNRTDRDEVSAEGRELGAFASRRIVDNTDDMVAERMPLPTISLSDGNSLLSNLALSSAVLRDLPVFVPLIPEAHQALVHVNCRLLSAAGGDVAISAAIGMPSGATVERTATQQVGTTSNTVLTFPLDLRLAQQQGSEILPVLIGIESGLGNESTTVVVRDRNRRSIDGDAHGIAPVDGETVSFLARFEDSTKPGEPVEYLGPIQAYANVAQSSQGAYWVWPQLPLTGPSESIDRMILTRLGSVIIDSISIEYVRLDQPYYSTRALPTQRRLESAQLQVASSMPLRTSPEHAMLSAQDYLLGSRPQIYAVGPGTHDNTGMVASTATPDGTPVAWLWIPVDAAQGARKLDGDPGEIRGFEIVIGCIGVAEENSEQVDITFRVELIQLSTGGTQEPTVTVLKTQTSTQSITSTTDVRDYARNVVGFSDAGANSIAMLTKHQLAGLYPDWQWYRDRLNIVRLQIEENEEDERPHVIRVTASGSDLSVQLYTTTYYVTDLNGALWANKIKDPAP